MKPTTEIVTEQLEKKMEEMEINDSGVTQGQSTDSDNSGAEEVHITEAIPPWKRGACGRRQGCGQRWKQIQKTGRRQPGPCGWRQARREMWIQWMLQMITQDDTEDCCYRGPGINSCCSEEPFGAMTACGFHTPMVYCHQRTAQHQQMGEGVHNVDAYFRFVQPEFPPLAMKRMAKRWMRRNSARQVEKAEDASGSEIPIVNEEPTSSQTSDKEESTAGVCCSTNMTGKHASVIRHPNKGYGGPHHHVGPGGPHHHMGPGGPHHHMGPGGPHHHMGPGGPHPRMGPGGPHHHMGPGGPHHHMGPGGPNHHMGPGGPHHHIGPHYHMGPGGPHPHMGPGGPHHSGPFPPHLMKRLMRKWMKQQKKKNAENPQEANMESCNEKYEDCLEHSASDGDH